MSGTADNRQQEVLEIASWDSCLALGLLKCVRTCLEPAFIRISSCDVVVGPPSRFYCWE